MPPIGQTMSGSSARTGAHRSDDVGDLRVEDGDEPGDVALHDLLVEDVGLVDAGLRPGLGRVLHLHRHRGPRERRARRVDEPGERSDRWRLRGRGGDRRGRGASSELPACRRSRCPATARTPPTMARTTTTAPATATTFLVRGVKGLHLLQPRDAIPERRVRVEQAVDARAACRRPWTRAAARSTSARWPWWRSGRPPWSSRSFSSAEMSPGGYRVSCTPLASARYSRLRLIAICMK